MIRTLPLPELGKPLRHIRDWNSTSNTSGIAQTVLHAILKLRRAEDVRAAFVATSNTNTTTNNNNLPPSLEPNDEDEAMPSTQSAVRAKTHGLCEVVEALIPYTERHLTQTECMVQDSYVLDFLIGEVVSWTKKAWT